MHVAEGTTVPPSYVPPSHTNSTSSRMSVTPLTVQVDVRPLAAEMQALPSQIGRAHV